VVFIQNFEIDWNCNEPQICGVATLFKPIVIVMSKILILQHYQTNQWSVDIEINILRNNFNPLEISMNFKSIRLDNDQFLLFQYLKIIQNWLSCMHESSLHL